MRAGRKGGEEPSKQALTLGAASRMEGRGSTGLTYAHTQDSATSEVASKCTDPKLDRRIQTAKLFKKFSLRLELRNMEVATIDHGYRTLNDGINTVLIVCTVQV